jgi:hypothetical protein
MKGICTVLASLALLPALAYGQLAMGTITGVVTDPNGAIVPTAKLVATDVARKTNYEAITSEAGIYIFPSVPVGTYSITVEVAGFKRLLRSGIEVRVAQRLDLDLQLELGDVQQTVEVTAEIPLLETTTSERGQNFSPQFMDNLPLFTGGIRNPRVFVQYMPGFTMGHGDVSVSGSGGRAQEVMIDGGSLTIPESGGTVFNFPSAEIFGEFKLLTGTFSAEYGRFGGGVEMYVSKSGGNWVRGTVFHNMRRDIWNANSWQFNSIGRARPKERFNETGGAIGGPVYIPKLYDGRNKTFWFFTYTADIRPMSITFPVLTVPTVRMKRGDFGEAGAPPIFDPLAVTGGVRAPFPNQQVPTARFSQVSRNLLPLLPDPNVDRLVMNYNFVSTSQFERSIWSLKFDHNFSSTQRLSFFFTNEVQSDHAISNFQGPIGNGLQMTQLPWNLRLNHMSTFSPNLLAVTTFSKSITRQLWHNPEQRGWGSRLGLPGMEGVWDAMPRIFFLGAAGLSPYGILDGKVDRGGQDNDTLMITQNYTYLRGRHELKFGWDARWLSTFPHDYAGANGRYFFNRAQTAMSLGTVATTGHEFASLLLGSADRADRIVPPMLFDPINYNYIAGFFQDNWRVNSRLTLNIGLRYEVPVAWHIPNGFSSFDPNRSNPGAAGRSGAYVFAGEGAGRTGTTRLWPMDFSNIGPRVGFAYRLTDKTVIRGGWGLFYQTLGNGGCGCRLGFHAANAVESDGFNPVLNWDGGIPIRPGYRPPPHLDPTIANFMNADYMGPTFGRAPRIQNWSLNIQHEFKNWLFDIAYQGNRGQFLNSTVDLNQLPTHFLGLGPVLGRAINHPSAIAAGITEPYPGFISGFQAANAGRLPSVAQALRPFPQYLSVFSRNAAVGRTWYDSLQVKVERRYGDFQFMGTYVWSKALSVAHFRQVFGQFGMAIPQDYYNIMASKSHLPFDQPHVGTLLMTYTLPFGKNKRFLGSSHRIINALVSNWTISSASRWASGNLIQIVTPGNPLGAGVIFAGQTKAMATGAGVRTGQGRMDLDPNVAASRWLNPGAFVPAPAFTLGTSAFFHDDMRQPPTFSDNIGIVKRTVLWENDRNPVTLTYRADAFNAFNRTNFGGVVGLVGNVNFGRPTLPQLGPRLITMGLRLDF